MTGAARAGARGNRRSPARTGRSERAQNRYIPVTNTTPENSSVVTQ